MCSFMTKPSHSGLMYHLSLLPQTLCSSHTAPSPHLLAFLCAASSSKNVLSDYSLLLPFPKPSLPVLYLLTFQEPDQAFPSPRSLLWPPVLDWDDHSTWAHAHPGTLTPKHHCLFWHWTHSFLCQVSGGSTRYTVLAGWNSWWNSQKESWVWSVYTERNFPKFQFLDV